jgi:tRNA-dependent cyclodipeptide synthase
MRIADLYNATENDLARGAFNPYLGISVKNRAFTPEAIAAFTRWGVEHAREKFALLVVDILQRFNNEIFERAATLKALEKALKQSDPIREHCLRAVEALPPEKRDRVVILEWADIVTGDYAHNSRLVLEAFEDIPAFRAYILDAVSRNLGAIVERLSQEEITRLCRYVLYEIAEFICGFRHQGVHFNLCVYPGSIAYLTRDLIGQDFFRPVLAGFLTSGPVAHAEMYPPENGPDTAA